MYVKKSEIRNEVGDRFRVSADFYESVDTAVHRLLREAQRRAADNGRKTLRPCDL